LTTEAEGLRQTRIEAVSHLKGELRSRQGARRHPWRGGQAGGASVSDL
jgi:hypothetical protein